MLIGVLADTHIPRRAKDLPAKAYQLLSGVDAIIHAGDLVTLDVLKKLETVAPVYAVMGNNDLGFALPERLEHDWEGIHVAVIHDSGAAKGRSARLRRWFPQADIVVFGHSHIPVNTTEEGLHLFNPGSPTDRRRQPAHTMGLLRLERGTIQAEILEV